MNSRITWPPYLKWESENLANYLATLLNVRVRKSRVLLGHFVKFLILLWIRVLLVQLTSGQYPKISRITWPPYLKSESENLSYYFDTLFKVRVRKSRVLLGHFRKILILLKTRALLGHFTLSQSPKISRITWPPSLKSESGYLGYYLATYKNSYTPKNTRIIWPPYLKSEYGNLAHYLATL